MKLGVYIHIPFCRRKCDYCAFYSIPVGELGEEDRESLYERYIDKLLLEIGERSSDLSPYTVDTIYLGGGTPSLLRPEHVSRLIGGIAGKLRVDHPAAEISLECNPEDFSGERAAGYVAAGVNRLILGLQTFNESLRLRIGRSAGVVGEKMLEEFLGLKGISRCLDIIAGIPGQTTRGLIRELEYIVRYRPDHASIYILSIEKGTPLAGRMHYSPALERTQRSHLKSVIAFMKRSGYRHYEVSNFALPGQVSRHNMKYWSFMPYAGFGAGAHSFYGGVRKFNRQSVKEYLHDDSVALAIDSRTKNAEVAEYLMTGLRLRDGFTTSDFERKLGIPLPGSVRDKLGTLRKRGYVAVRGKGNDARIRLTLEGMLIMDGLVYEMVEELL